MLGWISLIFDSQKAYFSTITLKKVQYRFYGTVGFTGCFIGISLLAAALLGFVSRDSVISLVLV